MRWLIIIVFLFPFISPVNGEDQVWYCTATKGYALTPQDDYKEVMYTIRRFKFKLTDTHFIFRN